MTDAMREAVRNGLEAAGFENVERIITNAECDNLIADVLRAADAGETGVPWRWRKARYGDGIWIVYKNGSKIYEFFSEPEARAVAAALNRVSP